MNPQNMTHEDRLRYFAEAKRATAKREYGLVAGVINGGFVGRVRGIPVEKEGTLFFETKEEALQCAREFIESCRAQVSALGESS